MSILNGLSEMGKSVAQTAQAWTLEQQKAELDKEKLTVADQLASAREEKGREFMAGESDKTRTFQSGESEKDRGFKAGESKLDRDSRLATTSISAGAGLRAAEIQRETQIQLQKMKDSADPDVIRTAKALEQFTPEQWDAFRKFQEIQGGRRGAPEHEFGWEANPDEPGGMRPKKGGPRDPGYIGDVEKEKNKPKIPEAFRKLETEVRTVGGAIDRFEQVVKKYGGGSLSAFLNDPTSKEAQEYNTAFMAMKTALRSEAFVNTGVLQPAEMAMLDKDLLAPTTVRGLLSNPEAYKAKMDELRRFLDNKIQSSYTSHGQQMPADLKFYKPDDAKDAQAPARKAPAVGTLEQGYRFKGGDPADRTNWERAVR